MKFRETQIASFTSISNVAKEWRDALCCFSHRLYFSKDVIQQLNNGLKLGHFLELPFQLACNFQCLGELFCGDTGSTVNIIRPFNHMM